MESGAYISDLRHFMDRDGSLVRGGPAGRFAAFLATIVESACVRTGESIVPTPVACSRRPNRMPCPGFVTAGIASAQAGPVVEWSCPACGMHGVTSGWEGSAHDLRDVAGFARRDRGAPQAQFELDRDAMRVVRTPRLVSRESAAVLAAARPSPSGLAEVIASADAVEVLARELAGNDRAVPAGAARRRLRRAVDVIEAALAAREATSPPLRPALPPEFRVPVLPPPLEQSPLEAAVERLRSGEHALQRHAPRVEPRSQALYASLADLQHSLILTTGAIWPEVALEAARRLMGLLAEVGGHVQDEDEIAVLIEDLAVSIVALARDADAPVLPELERMVELHMNAADHDYLLTKLPRGLARAGLTAAERDYLATRGLLAHEPLH